MCALLYWSNHLYLEYLNFEILSHTAALLLLSIHCANCILPTQVFRISDLLALPHLRKHFNHKQYITQDCISLCILAFLHFLLYSLYQSDSLSQGIISCFSSVYWKIFQNGKSQSLRSATELCSIITMIKFLHFCATYILFIFLKFKCEPYINIFKYDYKRPLL